jgi:hypothetical protein
MKKVIIIILILLALTAVGYFAFTEFEDYKLNKRIAECEAAGGLWQTGFLEICNLPTSDARKPCTDGSQCESVCVLDESLNKYFTGTIKSPLLDPEAIKGHCFEWSHDGGWCHFILTGGEPGMVCAD